MTMTTVITLWVFLMLMFSLGYYLGHKQLVRRLNTAQKEWHNAQLHIRFSVSHAHNSLKGSDSLLDAWYRGLTFKVADEMYNAVEGIQAHIRKDYGVLPDKEETAE